MPYAEALLSAVPKPDPDFVTERIIVPGGAPNPANPPPGCKFHPRCRYAEGICSEEIPAFREISPAHMVACHLAERLSPSGIA